MGAFVDGCPVCKGTCCCRQSTADSCPRKYHCYKRCLQQWDRGHETGAKQKSGSPWAPAYVDEHLYKKIFSVAKYFLTLRNEQLHTEA